MAKEIKKLESVTVRFAGDSGDGMQMTGARFGDTAALAGHDIATLPDYPSEIRAPAGTTSGVSGFQLNFSSQSIDSPGDQIDVLVAMNPAAVKVNLKELKKNAIIIVNQDAFDAKNLKLAGYENNPLEDDSLSAFKVVPVPITTLTKNALEDSGLSPKEIVRCKNFFALGLMFWLYSESLTPTIKWIEEKFEKQPTLKEANIKVLKAGYNFGDNTRLFTERYKIEPAKLEPGVYRNVSGNEATALGCVTASLLSNTPLFLGSYPITPASEILQYLSKYKNYGVITFQAEDEIAGITSAIGAAFGGSLAVTTTSGPGLALKTEAIGLAVMTELPLVIINVQRGGPSTGLPTKTEDSDLLQAVYGRNGEAPVVVLCASSPKDCFYMTLEAFRIAVKYMTPVILLTDGYIANGSEPFKIPKIEDLPKIEVKFLEEGREFYPYMRNANLARPWVKPGTPGLEHRIGGLEKSHIFGTVSYDPENHDFMVRLRAEKIANVQKDIPDVEVLYEPEGELLVLGWGGTYGAIFHAVEKARKAGLKVSQAHLNYINPFPRNLGNVLLRFNKVLIPEVNLGQLAKLIRSEYLIKPIQFNKVRGLPLKSFEIQSKILEILSGDNDDNEK